MTIIYAKDRGIRPGEDITRALYGMLDSSENDVTYLFEPGDYFFSPIPELERDYRISNSDVMPFRKLGILIKEKKNLTLDFSGARLWFSGHMQPFTLDRCENVTVRNCVIDWKKPLVAEGIVTAFTDTYIDMKVDGHLFPHRMKDNWLEFDTGNDEWYPLTKWSQIQFDGQTRTVRRASGDKFQPTKIEPLGDDVYRFYAARTETAVGNIFVLRHNDRIHAGIFCEKCRNTVIEDVTVYSCGGLGCLSQFCENLTYRRVHFIPNTAAGRKISNGRDDGMHITCCSGRVTITECTFAGLMDDPINVHSCCVTACKVLDDHTLQCKYRHPQACGFHYWAEAGDTIVFIERKHMSPVGKAVASSYTLSDDDYMTFTLSFDAPLPAELLALAADPEALALDNLSHTAEFVCEKNRFGSCRARGILVSTPKAVRIRENYFASSGSAILVAGDSNYWFESGACHDVEISRNVFSDVCLTSEYQFGEGVISVCPVVPEPLPEKPFHSNITIRDNVFDTADTPVLYAFSTEGLTFAGNRIFKSPAAEKWHPGSARIRLSYCSHVLIRDNDWIGSFGINGLDAGHCTDVFCADKL